MKLEKLYKSEVREFLLRLRWSWDCNTCKTLCICQCEGVIPFMLQKSGLLEPAIASVSPTVEEGAFALPQGLRALSLRVKAWSDSSSSRKNTIVDRILDSVRIRGLSSSKDVQKDSSSVSAKCFSSSLTFSPWAVLFTIATTIFFVLLKIISCCSFSLRATYSSSPRNSKLSKFLIILSKPRIRNAILIKSHIPWSVYIFSEEVVDSPLIIGFIANYSFLPGL